MESTKKFGKDFTFQITQVIGLTNDDAVSKEHRPFKQIVERLNRTYKASYRKTNGFDNIEGANYDLALWVAYYNFLRPHKHNKYKVLNEVEMLQGADNMPGKWQLLIFLWPTNHPEHAENRNCWIGSELLSIEPWNTGAGGAAGCEDMPRKSIDISPRIILSSRKGATAPFSCLPARMGSAKPEIGRRRSVSSLKAMTAWRTAMPACCGVSAPVNEHPNIRPTAAVFFRESRGIEFQNPWKRIGTCISVRNAAPCAQYMRYGVPCVRMPVPEHPASQHTGHGHMFPRFTASGYDTARGSHCMTERIFPSLIWSVGTDAAVDV